MLTCDGLLSSLASRDLSRIFKPDHTYHQGRQSHGGRVPYLPPPTRQSPDADLKEESWMSQPFKAIA